jgi:hypothetical protein
VPKHINMILRCRTGVAKGQLPAFDNHHQHQVFESSHSINACLCDNSVVRLQDVLNNPKMWWLLQI